MLEESTSGGPRYAADVFDLLIPASGEPNVSSLRLDREQGEHLVYSGEAPLTDEHGSFTIEAWVRLATLGNDNGSTAERQTLVEKNDPRSGAGRDAEFVFLVNGDRYVRSNRVTYGKADGRTGREMVLYFGVPDSPGINGTIGVASHLEVADSDWHFVSAAYDARRGRVRFVVDDEVDLVEAVPSGLVRRGNAPLIVGGHYRPSPAGGSLASSFDGMIDELRISPGVLPIELLLRSPSPNAEVQEDAP